MIKDSDFEKMTPDELREARKKIAQINKKRPYEPPGRRLYGYLPPDYAKYLSDCIEYAYENDLIDEKKPHNFVSWVVKEAIRDIYAKINEKRRIFALELNQE